MDQINLQSKTKALAGVMDCRWFENEAIRLQRTLFHRIVIPLQPFDSGLEYVSQPEKTEIYIDWIELGYTGQKHPENFILNKDGAVTYEASIYIGAAHNPIDIDELRVTLERDDLYSVEGKISIDFEHERVARNEKFEFQTFLEYQSAA